MNLIIFWKVYVCMAKYRFVKELLILVLMRDTNTELRIIDLFL
jgi:hypothetical protein